MQFTDFEQSTEVWKQAEPSCGRKPAQEEAGSSSPLGPASVGWCPACASYTCEKLVVSGAGIQVQRGEWPLSRLFFSRVL